MKNIVLRIDFDKDVIITAFKENGEMNHYSPDEVLSALQLIDDFNEYFREQFSVDTLATTKNLNQKSLLHKLKNIQSAILANAELIEKTINDFLNNPNLDDIMAPLAKIKNAFKHLSGVK